MTVLPDTVGGDELARGEALLPAEAGEDLPPLVEDTYPVGELRHIDSPPIVEVDIART